MFLFQKNHVKQIILGTKTQTRRNHKTWRANVGAIHQVRTELFGKPHCHIRITSKWKERLGDISIGDARAEGGYMRGEYITGLIKMLKGAIDRNTVLKVYRFEVVKCKICGFVIEGSIVGSIQNPQTGDKWPVCGGCYRRYKLGEEAIES